MNDHRGRFEGHTALILGNGPSRLHLDLVRAREDAIIIGCNAAHRDTPADYVCAVDGGIVDEWAAVGTGVNPIGNRVEYVMALPADKGHDKTRSGWPIHRWRPVGRSGLLSGQVATLLAMWLGARVVVYAGFDESGLNVYAGTDCYAGKNAIGPDKRGNPHPQGKRLRAVMPQCAADWGCELPEEIQLVQDFELWSMPHTFDWAMASDVPEGWICSPATFERRVRKWVENVAGEKSQSGEHAEAWLRERES